MKSIRWIACLLPSLLLGCSPWVGGFYYVPHPGFTEVPATQPLQPPVVAAFATIEGVRYPDDQLHLPYTVEVILRLENNGPDTVHFDSRSMDLTTGDLVRFGPPVLLSPPVPMLAPGQTMMVTVDFPFPAGSSFDQLDLSSLHLRWSVQVGTQNQPLSIQFQRGGYRYYGDLYYYEGPYAYPYPYPYVGGVVVVRHRW